MLIIAAYWLSKGTVHSFACSLGKASKPLETTFPYRSDLRLVSLESKEIYSSISKLNIEFIYTVA